MAGLQITPGVPGNLTPTAPTTRAASSVDATTAASAMTSSTEIRTPNSRDTSAVDEATTRQREKERTDSVRESAIQRREEALENVVSRSEDGDTLQVSEDGATEQKESTDGAVLSKTEETETDRTAEEDIAIEPVEAPEIEPIEVPEIEAAEEVSSAEEAALKEEAAAEASEEEASNITSFVGYTDQQVQQMYIEGEISQNDYNNEIARREEERQSRMEELDKLGSDMGRLREADSRVGRADFAIEKATESGNDRIGLNERLQAVDDVFTEREAAVRRQQEAGRLWDYQLQV